VHRRIAVFLVDTIKVPQAALQFVPETDGATAIVDSAAASPPAKAGLVATFSYAASFETPLLAKFKPTATRASKYLLSI
jgi:hypothetical protein